MKDQFVPYEIALNLREKGFDKQCFAYFDGEKEIQPIDTDFKNFRSIGECISAPLWQQVIDWFREKHNLIMWVEARYCFKKKYFWFIHFDVLIKDDIFDLHIETYEEARQEVIEHALTLI